MTPAQQNEARFLAAFRGAPDDPVLALYKRLVHGNVLGVLRGVLPRTAAARGPLLASDVDTFLRGAGPRTAHVRDVPAELVRSADAWPAWVRELARFELVDFETSYATRGTPAAHGEIALDAPLVFREPVRLESFELAVQTEPQRRDPHALLFYRDDDDAVRTLRLSPMAAVMTARALTGETMQSALIAAATAVGLQLDEDTLASAARFLDDLSERGVLLGGAIA